MSESIEMYLETILILHKRLGHVRAIDIVHEMGYSKPTVSQQMKRLSAKGLVHVDQQGFITLTDEGREIADMILERHNELSKILVYLGVEESTAAEDACRIEHYISAETFDAIKAYFQDKIK